MYTIEEMLQEHMFLYRSLVSNTDLQATIRKVYDIIFGVVMVTVLQWFNLLGFDFMKTFSPFLTLILSISFAIAPLVGQILLATTFVVFMLPYDIGK
jgi:hypothetical protein